MAQATCDRGGLFKLVELWLENKFMLEVMSDHEWDRYKVLYAAVGQMIQARRSAGPA